MTKFAGYQVNAELLEAATPEHIVLHCLPAHVGEEITEDVLHGPALGGVGRGREPPACAEGAARPRYGVSARRPLLIVDGDSYAHRAYHALPPIEGAGGRPVNALVGVANLVVALWVAEQPRAVLVCWDTVGTPTYRNELWPAYQTGREFDDEIVEQLQRLPDLITALGFSVAKVAGYEADDLLASAAMAESMDGGTALVATSDRDAYQLVSDAVTVLAPQTGGSRRRGSAWRRSSSATGCCPSRWSISSRCGETPPTSCPARSGSAPRPRPRCCSSTARWST